MPKEPIPELLAAIDALVIAWATAEDEKKIRARVIEARRNVAEVVASNDQLLAVLEHQIALAFRPIVNERDLRVMLKCSNTWLSEERKKGRWLNFHVDARGHRHYTHEQIIANFMNEKPKLKAA